MALIICILLVLTIYITSTFWIVPVWNIEKKNIFDASPEIHKRQLWLPYFYAIKFLMLHKTKFFNDQNSKTS
jgi:hypothetical protein